MFFRSIFSLLSASLLFLAAHAAPVTSRDDFLAVAPEVTSPAAGDKWTGGSMQTVKWDTTKIPQEANAYTVDIYLGQMSDNPTSENLDMNHPLAQNVPITAGSYLVTVPSDREGNGFIVVVDGDSGNASGQFTIVQQEQSIENLINGLL